MLKHCPSLRMDRGDDRCSTHNKELEIGGKMGKLEGKGISEQETSSEIMTTAFCPNCGGQHRRLRVYRASPAADHKQHKQADHKQQNFPPMMDFTTVLLSPTTTSAMVVEESLRR